MRLDGIKDWLAEPEVVGCNMDEQARLRAHLAVLEKKPLIRDVFTEFHLAMRSLDERLLRGSGARIELGAGVYPVRNSFPDVLATDVVPAPHLDRTLDAQAMELPDSSVRAFYLQNVFHHFPEPRLFFNELVRTLLPGGGAVIIEPHGGALGRWLYPRLFASERFDTSAPGWESGAGGPMVDANQALSEIVFDRDLARFEAEYPGLEIVHRDVLANGMRYLLSGGLNFRALVPGWGAPIVGLAEKIASPARRVWGLHRVLVLRRT